MPMYDYQCTKCGNVHEDLVKLSQRDEPQDCRACDGTATRAMITPPRIDWLGMGYQKNVSPEFIDRYERVIKQQKAKEEKSLRDHGDYGPRPGAD